MNIQETKPQLPVGISTISSKRGGDYIFKGIITPPKNIISPFLSSSIIYDVNVPYDERIF